MRRSIDAARWAADAELSGEEGWAEFYRDVEYNLFQKEQETARTLEQLRDELDKDPSDEGNLTSIIWRIEEAAKEGYHGEKESIFWYTRMCAERDRERLRTRVSKMPWF